MSLPIPNEPTTLTPPTAPFRQRGVLPNSFNATRIPWLTFPPEPENPTAARIPEPFDGDNYRLYQRSEQIKAMLPGWILSQFDTTKMYQAVGRELHLLRAYWAVRRKIWYGMRFAGEDEWTEKNFEWYFRFLEKKENEY